MWIWWVAVSMAGPYAQEEDLPTHMDAHFAAATDASWFIALGDLERMKEAAAKLDHPAPASMPKDWRPQVRRMQRAARALSEAPNVAAASTLVVDLGATCASCHQTLAQGPRLTDDDVKMQVLTPVGQHALAPYWLWVGWLMNSDAAWNNGARAMVGAPAHTAAMPYAEAYDAFAAQTKTASPLERGPLMASILGSCVACHEAAGVQIGP